MEFHDHGHDHDHAHPHGHAHPHTKTKAVSNRLARIIGHLEHVKRMVDDGADCAEVLTQMAAVRSALNGAAKVILKDHIEHCIVDAIEAGDSGEVSSLNRAIELFMN